MVGRISPADDRRSPGIFHPLKQLAGVYGNASFFGVVDASGVVSRINSVDDGFGSGARTRCWRPAGIQLIDKENFNVGAVATIAELDSHW